MDLKKINVQGRIEITCPCGGKADNGVKKVKQETKKEDHGIVQTT